MKHDLEANKKNAVAFYRTAYLGDPATAVQHCGRRGSYRVLKFYFLSGSGLIPFRNIKRSLSVDRTSVVLSVMMSL